MCFVIVRKKGCFSRCFLFRFVLFLSGCIKFKSSFDFVLYSDFILFVVLFVVIMNLKMVVIIVVVFFVDKYIFNVNSKEFKRFVI